jgi:hypothetical protein
MAAQLNTEDKEHVSAIAIPAASAQRGDEVHRRTEHSGRDEALHGESVGPRTES